MFDLKSSLIFSLFLLLVTFFIYKWFFVFSKNSENQPPSPRKLPILGNLHQLGLFPHRSLQKLSQKYGPLMLLHLGRIPVLIASSAEAAREIMKTHDLIFSNRPKVSIPDRLFYGSKEIAFAPYGEYWRQVRSISVLHLLSNKRVQSYRNVREEETSLMIKKIANSSRSSELVNLSGMIALLTNDVVCRVALGKKYSDGEMGRKFSSMLREFSELMGTFYIGDYIPWLAWVTRVNGLDAKVKRVHEEFDEFFEGVIKEHRKETKDDGDGGGYNFEGARGCDFVDILLEIQRTNALGFPIQDETIKAMIWDMFSAGTDTTFTTLDWAISELIHNPETMSALQNEVRQIAQGREEICEDDLVKMQYLKAVIKETLRLHAPVPLLVPREATQNIKLMGYDIKAGTQVFINAWCIGRDSSSWENPEKFRPERFLNNNIDFKGFDFELIPFGAGRRGCPGSTFAVSIVELALAKLVHKFNFALPDGLRGEDLDMTEINGLNIQRKFPLLVTATPSCG